MQKNIGNSIMQFQMSPTNVISYLLKKSFDKFQDYLLLKQINLNISALFMYKLKSIFGQNDIPNKLLWPGFFIWQGICEKKREFNWVQLGRDKKSSSG